MARRSPRHYLDERGLLLPLVCVQSSEVSAAATSQTTVRTEAGLCSAVVREAFRMRFKFFSTCG